MGWISMLGGDAQSAAEWFAQEVISPTANAAEQQAIQGDPSVRMLLWFMSQFGVTDPGPWLQVFAPGLVGLYQSDPEDFNNWLKSIQGKSGQPAMAVQQQQKAAPAPTTPSTATVRGSIPANIDVSVVDAVLRAARDTNVPYALALAIAQQESGFNANARHQSSQEDSWGVFQLNTMGGEGAGLPEYVLADPYLNAKIALTKVSQVLQQHPDWSWGQVAVTAQGADNTNNSYVNAINNYVDQVQTGQGTLGWGLSTIRVGDPSFQTNVQYGANSVPMPFNSSYFDNVTQSFGQNGEQGTDFGMPVGQQISTPVGGTISLRDDGKQNWGKAVYVRMPNGWTYFVGHMSNFAVQDGQQVGPGDVLGLSGGDPNDPSSGVSTGPHIEVRFIDPSGQNQDPYPILQQIYSGTGTTFSQWYGGVFSGSAQPAPQKQNLSVTPDHQLIDLNTQEGRWYQSVDQAWVQVFGVHAPLQAAKDFQAAGVTTVDALNNAINMMPSAIPGVTVGAYKGVSDTAQKQAQSAFGRAIPQSLISYFFQHGITNTQDIQLWFDGHSSSDIPPADYQAIYDAALPYTQALYGDVPSPSDVSQIHQQTSAPPADPFANLPYGVT